MSHTSTSIDRAAWRAQKPQVTRLSFSALASILTIVLYAGVVAFVAYSTVHGFTGDDSAATIFLGP